MGILKRREKSRDVLLAEARVILEATETVCEAMDEQGVTKKELADRLDVSASEITQRLQGQRNLTLSSVVEMLHALDRDLVLRSRPRAVPRVAGRLPRPADHYIITGGSVRSNKRGIFYTGEDVWMGQPNAVERVDA